MLFGVPQYWPFTLPASVFPLFHIFGNYIALHPHVIQFKTQTVNCFKCKFFWNKDIFDWFVLIETNDRAIHTSVFHLLTVVPLKIQCYWILPATPAGYGDGISRLEWVAQGIRKDTNSGIKNREKDACRGGKRNSALGSFQWGQDKKRGLHQGIKSLPFSFRSFILS